MCAVRNDSYREVIIRWKLNYAHKSLLINIGMVDPTISDNQLTQFLNGGLCPTIDLKL